MASLIYQMLDRALGEMTSASADIQALTELANGMEFTYVAKGICYPNVGIVGEWSAEQLQVVRNIIGARGEEKMPIHRLGVPVSGKYDSSLAKYEKFHNQLRNMKPGHLAKINADNLDCILAAFPAEEPASSLVLFLK